MNKNGKECEILIVDFGSQYTFLIAKQIRKFGYFCKIQNPLEIEYNDVLLKGIKLVILSGGPQSVYSSTLYTDSVGQIGSIILNPNICVLGICFGLQYICHFLDGGKVIRGQKGEYGKAMMSINRKYKTNPMISWVFSKRDRFMNFVLNQSTTDTHNNKNDVQVWMSHQDKVVQLPTHFVVLGTTKDCENAFIASTKLNVYGMQFHPEVKHTYKGKHYIKSLLSVCKCKKNWTSLSKITECEDYLKEKFIDDSNNVILGLSGGVDSTVVAFLLKRCLDVNRIKCVLIDHGMMRHNEIHQIQEMCKETGIQLQTLDTSNLFLNRLEGIVDPEEKRKIIGGAFIECFEDYVKILSNSDDSVNWLLAQGTIYPDVIESAKTQSSSLIKSHHNVGGLPEKMGLQLVEPLRMLFKNEVKEIGKHIGVPTSVLNRHPFPGPGIGIRIIGNITALKIEIVQKADKIFIDELKTANLYNKISQAYAGLLNSKSVGVVGDQRRYGWIVCLRAITTKDFMTAIPCRFKGSFLEDVGTKIINAIPQVSRVMYDITSKPPGTIELE